MNDHWIKNSFKARFLFIFCAWTFIGILLATQAWVSYKMRGEAIDWWLPITIWFSWAYIWALLTPIVAKLVARNPLEPPKRIYGVIVHLFSGVFFSAINLAIFAVIAPLVGSINVGSDWVTTFVKLMGSTFILNLPVYWLIVGVTLILRLSALARKRERRALILEKQLVDAKLLTLREQLQPHFLFNALNTIAVLMREDVEVANRVLLQLSGLLRRAIEASVTQKVKLRDEIEFLTAYLEIEKTRFSNRLNYIIDIDSKISNAYIPSLILQPLIENSVQHGLSGINRIGEIKLQGFRNEKNLVLSVQDNGNGMDCSVHDGVGLSNTRARLKLLYGNKQSFELTSHVDGGLLATLIIPLEMEVIQ